MTKMVFDTGQLLLCGGFALWQVAYTTARQTCNYVDNGIMKTKQCEYGCCGNDPNDQECCDASDNNNENERLWIIVGASVGGGLALLSLLILVVFCCIVKKQNAIRKIHTESAGAEMVNVQRMRRMTPPPAYTYNSPNAFMTGTGGTQQTGGLGAAAPSNNQPGGSGSEAPVHHPPPRYSSLEKRPLGGNNR